MYSVSSVSNKQTNKPEILRIWPILWIMIQGILINADFAPSWKIVPSQLQICFYDFWHWKGEEWMNSGRFMNNVKEFWISWFKQSNLVRGIDKKTIRRKGILICLLMSLLSNTLFLRKQNGLKLQSFLYLIYSKN